MSQCKEKPETFAHAYIDLTVQELITHGLQNNEGVLAANQAFTVKTGQRTGRSPLDRFIVREKTSENDIAWGAVNQPFSAEQFTTLWDKAQAYLQDRTVFIANLCVGADAAYSLPVQVITDTAWQNLFAKQLFIRENRLAQKSDVAWTIMSASGLKLDPSHDGSRSDGILIIHFGERKILLCGMTYAGEIKKAMFSVLNYWLPKQGVLPMHCAANVGSAGDVALFFGLSGTGKTTLSADPERYLIGDDEHGWSTAGIFNFEGGCYAKCIDLSAEREPVIWQAIRAGTIMENVVLDPLTKEPLFHDASLTQNTRAAYPREYISARVEANKAGQPQAVIFLTCDLYGVLPPVARLTKEQAAYYFLSGYTALVGSTEMGQTAAIKSTFSACFGAPFFPRPPQVYAELLMQRIAATGCEVYLVNTGWAQGAYGEGGERFSIPLTRAVIRAILTGDIKRAQFEQLPGFNVAIPLALPAVPAHLLDPRKAWQDKVRYAQQAQALIGKFIENFQKFNVSAEIAQAGPKLFA